MTEKEEEKAHRPFGPGEAGGTQRPRSAQGSGQSEACATGWTGRPFAAQGKQEAGATKNRERVRDKKGAAGGRGASAKPNLETGPGYLPFFGAFLSPFLAFFAMQIS